MPENTFNSVVKSAAFPDSNYIVSEKNKNDIKESVKLAALNSKCSYENNLILCVVFINWTINIPYR
ncbi:MAG: hypothetical protein ABFS12_13025 [Bacteroidota bacterium]